MRRIRPRVGRDCAGLKIAADQDALLVSTRNTRQERANVPSFLCITFIQNTAHVFGVVVWANRLFFYIVLLQRPCFLFGATISHVLALPLPLPWPRCGRHLCFHLACFSFSSQQWHCPQRPLKQMLLSSPLLLIQGPSGLPKNFEGVVSFPTSLPR